MYGIDWTVQQNSLQKGWKKETRKNMHNKNDKVTIIRCIDTSNLYISQMKREREWMKTHRNEYYPVLLQFYVTQYANVCVNQINGTKI